MYYLRKIHYRISRPTYSQKKLVIISFVVNYLSLYLYKIYLFCNLNNLLSSECIISILFGVFKLSLCHLQQHFYQKKKKKKKKKIKKKKPTKKRCDLNSRSVHWVSCFWCKTDDELFDHLVQDWIATVILWSCKVPASLPQSPVMKSYQTLAVSWKDECLLNVLSFVQANLNFQVLQKLGELKSSTTIIQWCINETWK